MWLVALALASNSSSISPSLAPLTLNQEVSVDLGGIVNPECKNTQNNRSSVFLPTDPELPCLKSRYVMCVCMFVGSLVLSLGM